MRRALGRSNRFTETATGRVDRDGQPLMARRGAPAVARLRSDPFGPLVKALEVFDAATQTAKPAQILFERVLEPRELVVATDDPDEAIAVCLDRFGRLRIEDLAEILGQQPDEAERILGERAFTDPATGRLQPAAEYLSATYAASSRSRASAYRSSPSWPATCGR